MANSTRGVGRRAQAVVDRKVNEFGRALGLEVLSRLIRKTPVDTGHARGNWFAQPKRASTDEVDGRTAGTALTEGAAEIDVWDITRAEMHLTNNVPYIERLEDGWSGQAPNGMAKTTIVEVKPLADRIAAKVRRGA